MSFTRRRFIQMAIAMGAQAAWCSPFSAASSTSWKERRDLFPEGVASGDPDSSSVLLWTRRDPGTHPATKLTVEVAHDKLFRNVIATQTVPISAEQDWTCRILVGGLKPRKVYWYRFTDNDGNGSRIGRTITAPADNDARTVTFAFVSCQNENLGAQHAYRRMIHEDERALDQDQLGFVLHLGDFVYELVWYPEERPTYYDRKVRDVLRYKTGEKIEDFHIPVDLEDYRQLYRSYLHDPDLQDARARWPFVCMWDNHEFSWLGWQSVQVFAGKTRWAQTLKVAANQAFFEFQPARMLKPSGPSLQHFGAPKVVDTPISAFDDHGLGQEPNNLAAINSLKGYRSLCWGRNLDLIITDQRSYRYDDPTDYPEANALESKDYPIFFSEEIMQILDGGRAYNGGAPPDSIRFGDTQIRNFRKTGIPQTLLGAEQLEWFLNKLGTSKATWKIWGSTTASLQMRADPQNLPPGLVPRPWPAGYAILNGGDVSTAYYERGLIYDFIRKEGITGFATVAGDRHSFWAGLAAKDLPPKVFEPIGVAFVTGSVSAPGLVESYEHKLKKNNPLRALLLGQGPSDQQPQPTINMLLRHGVRSCLEYAKTGNISQARAVSNKDLSPHVSFVDMGGHGYSVVRVGANSIDTEFVAIPRPIQSVDQIDGGPLLYRVNHHARLWSRGKRPQLITKVLEGDPRFSI